MHSKIIQPGKHGRIAYDNKGSCSALVQYLGHEAKENKMPFSFFNSTREDISAEEVKNAMDHNVKGLRKGEVKFYSLILSPSGEELKHLSKANSGQQASHHKAFEQNSYEQKLMLFARQAMENYGANFILKDGKKLSVSDLQWYATLHHHRQYKGVHKEVKENEAVRGSLKPGPNAHIHIIVSKRDVSQKITLNPQGRKERFEITRWQKENERSFDKLFDFTRTVKQHIEPKVLTAAQKEQLDKRIHSKLCRINGMLEKGELLPQKKVEQIAEKKGYNQTFFYNLNRLQTNLRKGLPVYEPLHLLEHNKDKKPERLEGCTESEHKRNVHRLGSQIEKTFKVLADERMSIDEDLSMPHIKSGFKRRIVPDATQQKKAQGGITQTI